jgi:hypothetical protein
MDALDKDEEGRLAYEAHVAKIEDDLVGAKRTTTPRAAGIANTCYQLTLSLMPLPFISPFGRVSQP